MANACGVHRNHGLIHEPAQVGVEGGHTLPLVRVGGDMDQFHMGVRGEQPYGLCPPIA